MFKKAYLPNEVFTPRSSTVNQKMYVNRDALEKALARHISSGRHILIHGESGNGKTWLYKKVFSDQKINYCTINLATASRLGSLQLAFQDKVGKLGESENLSERIVTRTGGGEMVLKAEYSDERIYKIAEREPLEALMALLHRESGSRQSFIILDNLEQVSNNATIAKELSDTLILLDDEDYARYNVRFCIVGVPSDIREYLASQASLETISNRTVELPEVARLTREESHELLITGFRLLGLSASDESLEQMCWKTDRIAQHLHELGLEIAHLAIDRETNTVSNDIVELGIDNWFSSSLTAVKEALDHNMNARDTKAGRRNQVIYALGCLKYEDFKYTDLEERIREEFPTSTDGIALNVSQTLSQLEKSEHPLVKRVPKGDAYRMVNPKVRIAIRVTMEKNGEKAQRRRRYT